MAETVEHQLPSRYPLPSCWDERALTRSISKCLKISGLWAKYIGPSNENEDAASVRADYPVPGDLALYYFEVTVLNKGRSGFIGVGFSTADVRLERLPGWEPNSYGYHGDDGMAFKSSGNGEKYGPKFTTGDVVGVLLNRVERTISFTKNGMDLGIAFRNVMEERLYPTGQVGMRTPDEEVLANFGSRGFCTGLDAPRAEAMQHVQAQVERIHLPPKNQSRDFMGRLLFDHLMHHGQWRTAAAVARDVLGGTHFVKEQDVKDVGLRLEICKLLQAGDVQQAMQLTEQVAPNLLQQDTKLAFRLYCQQFIELVRGNDDERACDYSRTVLRSAALAAGEQQQLQDVMSLMAYTEPESSNFGSLMGQPHRAELADDLSSAIQLSMGRMQESALERLMRHSRTLFDELEDLGDPAASLIALQHSPP